MSSTLPHALHRVASAGEERPLPPSQCYRRGSSLHVCDILRGEVWDQRQRGDLVQVAHMALKFFINTLSHPKLGRRTMTPMQTEEFDVASFCRKKIHLIEVRYGS